MTREMICIECPLGCGLSADIENSKVTAVRGNKCPKGQAYALSEAQDPRRWFTAIVPAKGLELKMVPVKANRPIPKAKMMEAAREVRKIEVREPVLSGQVIVKNFLGLEADLVATRAVLRRQ